MKDFHDDLETGNDTDLLKASLALLVKTTEATNGALLNLGEITDHHVVQPILNFVKKDVRDARYFTHEVLKVPAISTIFSLFHLFPKGSSGL